MTMTMMLLIAALQAGPTVIDVTKGPVATTTVAVKVSLDAEGRVLTCRAATDNACAGFPKGRKVSAPIRKNGRPVRGTMTVSTTTVVSGE